MKQYPWILLTGGLLALAFAPGACGGGGGSTGGAGGTGGGASTTTTSGSTTTSTGVTTGPSSSSSSGGTNLAACEAPTTAPSNGACYTPPTHPPPASCSADAGAGDCSAILPANGCFDCVEASCCAEVSACNGIENCIKCATGELQDMTICGAQNIKDAITAINTCLGTCCEDACNPPCNPVTNEGCNTAAGEACDLSDTGFICFPSGNTEPLCAECSNANGPFCEPTLHCNEDGNGGSACARYCCDDGDCGANGKCDKSADLAGDGTLGTCVPK